MVNNIETAVFGGGCFWCTEAVFKALKGVVSVMPGYAGGKVSDPNYYEVATGKTGHAEVIKIDFEPAIISYDDLLEVFWNVHNPTTPNQQGADVGTQYRSIILTTSPAQKEKAEKSMIKLRESKQYDEPIVTEIVPLDKFYDAESYHKDYYGNHKDDPYCQIVINPKLEKLKKKFSSLISE